MLSNSNIRPFLSERMQNGIVLEVCVESIDYAVAAERGGANRIELCSDLASDGITPSAGLMETARHHTHLPIHVLVRPRAGDFLYSDAEFEVMERDIRTAKNLGMNGIVLGLLDQKQLIDVQRTRRLVDLARPLPVTFHRAFDLCQDWNSALAAVIKTGASRILTSGGEGSVTDNLPRLADIVEGAGERIAVMPGGGVRVSNVQKILRTTDAREIHSSLGMVRGATNNDGSLPSDSKIKTNDVSEFERRVREIRQSLKSVSLEFSPGD
jgi:copper homeostasis protein